MKIAILGATGRTGRHFVAHALRRGHTLHALVRDPKSAGLPAEVVVVQGDMCCEQDVRRCLEGCDAVVSLAGPKFGSGFSVMQTSARLLVKVMRNLKMERLVVVGGAAAKSDKDVLPEPIVMRALRRVIPILRDMGLYASILHQSGLQTTIVRPSTLKQLPQRPYRSGYMRKSMDPVGCEDVAAFVLECLEKGLYVREMPMIAYP